jgi:hypothetical protein
MSLNWGREVGAPSVPRAESEIPPWEVEPYASMAPYATERCVFYVLIGLLDFTLDIDFLYQERLPVKGINQTGLNRSDFWIQPRGKGAAFGVGKPPYWRGTVINPIASVGFIHNKAKDRWERDIIRQQAKIDVVYILDYMLYSDPELYVTLALEGFDKSGR